jgi:C-terminal processing protease CtpA/Prc
MRRTLIALGMTATHLPVHAQFPVPSVSVEHAVALGLVLKKSECSNAFPDLRPKLQEAFSRFARKNTGIFSEAEWKKLEQTTADSQRAAVPPRRDCEELLAQFATEDFDAASRDFSRELQEMREALAVASKGRGTLGVALDPKSVARVEEVLPNSPAEKAGILVGDTIARFDGKPIDRTWQLFAAIRSAVPGKKVGVTVLRQTVPLDLEAVVGQLVE